MNRLKHSLALSSIVVGACFLALLFLPVWGQEKQSSSDEKSGGSIRPPGADIQKETRAWRGITPNDKVVSTDSTPTLFDDREPFPPKGFARGVIVTLGDDSGAPGTYRLAFRWQANGQHFPLIECRQLQILEDKLVPLGPDSRRGKQLVEVKGTVTQYRGINFLLLSDFRLIEGPGQ